MNKKFNSIDMLVMENIVETIAKMDEVLNEVSKHLEKEFKVNCNKHSSRSTQICKRLRYPVYGSNILKCNGYSEILGNELEGYVHNNGINIFLAEPIQDFLSSETQVEDMKSWFKEQIEIMVKFKNETPNFGWK